MAKSRSKASVRGKSATAKDVKPDVYQELLEEAGQASSVTQHEGGKTVKKRRVGGRIVVRPDDANDTNNASDRRSQEPPTETDRLSSSPLPELALQTIDYNSDFSEEGDSDDDIFEDVNIDGDDSDDEEGEQGVATDGETLNLVLDDRSHKAGASSARKRRAVTAVSDKKLTVAAHKLHILCLLAHLSVRNHWCNDPLVQRHLRKTVPKKLKALLEDDEKAHQMTRDERLKEGLHKIVDVFKARFERTGRGLRRAWWDAPGSEEEAPSYDDFDLLTCVEDFRKAATELKGSRDVGAQVFCAMLRACGLDVRLACSLQVLPINGVIRPDTQVAREPAYVVQYEDTRTGMGSGADGGHVSLYDRPSTTTALEDPNTQSGTAAGIRRKMGRISGRSSSLTKFATPTSSKPPPTRSIKEPVASLAPARIKESPCPVYWVEVFNPAYQRWIPVDPLVTGTVSKPAAMCPAIKDIQHVLAYAVAIEEDGSARDVTRRYTTTYNAKTRKLRIDAMAGSEGSKWWRSVLKVYRRPAAMALDDRDSVEDAEFKRREVREGMPKNIEDFKGHPVYVLERHLRRNEILHPRRQVGTTGGERSSSNKGKSTEPVFRRQDVHPVKSAGAWYRLGREVKMGEQPVKRISTRPRRERNNSEAEEDDAEDDDGEDQGLYTFQQTELYEAPPVMVGKVPRNAFGNLDVYVPSMIPPGAVHILHQDTRHAAKLLGIDHVDAVTGFEFKGRQGTAVIKGAVVAAEYKDAVLEVLQGFEREKLDAAAAQLTLTTLSMWRRFLIGLRVKERVDAYARDDEAASENNSELEASDEDIDTMDDEGGFVPEASSAPKTRRKPTSYLSAGPRDDFTVLEGPRIEISDQKQALPNRTTQTRNEAPDSAEAGGFIPDDADGSLFGGSDGPGETDMEGGGFIVDGEEDNSDEKEHEPAGPTEADFSTAEAEDSLVLEQIHAMESRSGNATSVPAKEEAPMPTSSPKAVSDSASVRRQDNTETGTSHEDDKGSLLSEDPDDEDAEPDWLG